MFGEAILFIWFGPGRSTSFNTGWDGWEKEVGGRTGRVEIKGPFVLGVGWGVSVPRIVAFYFIFFFLQRRRSSFLCAPQAPLSSTGLPRSPDDVNERCNSNLPPSTPPPLFLPLPFDLFNSTIIFSQCSPPLHGAAVCSGGVALIKPAERQTGDKVPAHQFSFTSWTGAGPPLAKWRAFKLG